jgi:hypothetical protein
MLREQAPAEEEHEQEPAEEEVEQPVSRRVARRPVAAPSYASDASEDDEPSSSTSEEVPGYLQHLRQTRGRRPVRESASPPKPANPLSSPQYAGFFNALIASQKAEPAAPQRESDEQNTEAEEEQSSTQTESPEPSARSTVNPQYKGFFDAMVASQKPQPKETRAEQSSTQEPEPASSAPSELESPASSAQGAGGSVPYRDETATG